MNNNATDLRVKINGGYLVAEACDVTDAPGIMVRFEGENGNDTDIANVFSVMQNNTPQIIAYCFEDANTEDYTKKLLFDTKN